MFLYTVENHALGADLLKNIRNNPEDWQMVSLKLYNRDADLLHKFSQHLIGVYQSQSGMLIEVSDYKIIYFVKVGQVSSQMSLNAQLEREFKGFNPLVSSQNVNAEILDFFESEYLGENANHENSFYEARMNRTENHVLIIDDDMFIRKVISAGFSNLAQIQEVEDSLNSVRFYKEINPDIVFIDIHMPEKNGFDVCHDILKIDPDAYIVMVSSNASIENITKSISLGGDGFLAKPIRKDKLLEHAKRCATFQTDEPLEPFTVSS